MRNTKPKHMRTRAGTRSAVETRLANAVGLRRAARAAKRASQGAAGRARDVARGLLVLSSHKQATAACSWAILQEQEGALRADADLISRATKRGPTRISRYRN